LVTIKYIGGNNQIMCIPYGGEITEIYGEDVFFYIRLANYPVSETTYNPSTIWNKGEYGSYNLPQWARNCGVNNITDDGENLSTFS
jgi:hypothetical protein